MAKAKNNSASADDEVELIDDTGDEIIIDDAAASSAAPDELVDAGDEDPDDGTDEDGDDVDDDDSDPVKLERKRKLRAQARARAAEGRADELEERLRRIEEAQEQSTARARESERKAREEAVNQSITAAEQALEDAMEDGDTKRIIEAQRKLSRAEVEAAKMEQAPERPSRPAASTQQQPNKHAAEFIEKHSDWFDPTLSDTDSKRVGQLSAKLAAEGVSSTSAHHFKLLEDMAKEALPHRFSKPKPAARQSTASPSAGRMNGTDKPDRTSITRGQVRAFKEGVGLDWDHPDTDTRADHRKQIRDAISESRRARGAA